MNPIKLLPITVLLTSLAAQGVATYTYDGGHIEIRNFKDLSGDWTDVKASVNNKEKHAHISGEAANLSLPEKGLSVTGNVLDFRWAQADPKTIELREGTIEGKAVIHMDTEKGYQANLKFSASKHLPAPKAPAEFRVSQLETEKILYSGNVSRGTLTMPTAWKYSESDSGDATKVDDKKTSHIHFVQTFNCDAANGLLVIRQGQTGQLDQIESGLAEGPVHFKFIRDETNLETKVLTHTSYVGVADRVEINMLTQPGTVTASGHVIVDGDSNGALTNFKVDRLVMTVSPQMEPISVQMFSGVTTVKSKDGSR